MESFRYETVIFRCILLATFVSFFQTLLINW